MSTNQKSKTDNQKFVNKMLSILFPNHKYIDETRGEGPKFLQKLLENGFHTTVKILSTEPIYDTKGKKNLRSYAEPYAIEGTNYYVSSKWCWEGDSALKASKIILKLCNFPYVTEEARIKLQALSEQWKNGKLPDEEESSGYYILVADPKRFRFTDKEIGIEDSYSILNDEGKPRQKPWCYETAKAGDKLVCYEASPIQKVVAFGEVCEKNDTYLYFKKTINLPIHLTRSELLEDSDLKQVFQSPHGSLLDLTEAQYKKIQRMATKERNLIYFGAPGTGKSYLLNEKAKDFESSQSGKDVTECGLTEYVERVTFHTEYTYFDFVGSYKPIMDGENIIYDFEPGPFARVLKKALSNPGKQYLLLIEEINRARVAAVFGDIFQLLDRDENGKSCYAISISDNLREYISSSNEDAPSVEIADGKLRIPHNMYLWATMNSADQGVFPMDTAFKRRWSYTYIGINNGEKTEKRSDVEDAWYNMRRHINTLLQHAGINEDKQMGYFFLKSTELRSMETFQKSFKEKVLMYLYEDAARHIRGHIFKNGKIRYSQLCKDFETSFDAIFKDIPIEK